VSVAPLIANAIGEIESRKEADMAGEQEGRKHLKKHVRLNESGEQDLAAVDVIGPQHAHEIVAYRQEHGPFQSLDDLESVPGIEASLVSKLRELVSAEGWHV
jgi:competence ComEA-like helix-hairpin-helix protein